MDPHLGLEKVMHVLAEYSLAASGAKRRVAAYLMSHLEEVAFVTLDKVGKATGISASTITRTVSEMGFRGFPGFQGEIREIIKMKLLPAGRSRILPVTGTSKSYSASLKIDRENLEDLENLNPTEKFEQATALISKARLVHVCGMQASHGPAGIFGNYLSQIRPGVRLFNLRDMSLSEQILDMTEQDVLLVCSLPPYHTFSVGIADDALKRGCSLITVTDNPLSTLGLKSTVAFAVPYKSASFFNSHVAACSLLNSLLSGINLAIKQKALKRLTEHEELLNRWRLYETPPVPDKKPGTDLPTKQKRTSH